jgi:hypothetical protein
MLVMVVSFVLLLLLLVMTGGLGNLLAQFPQFNTVSGPSGPSGPQVAPVGPTGPMPQISARSYNGGSSPVNVNGTFNLGDNLNFDFGNSDGFDTTLRFGASQETGQVLIGISSDPAQGYGLNVFNGPWVATSMGNCMWDVRVTPTLVSGHVSCMDVPAVDQETGAMGEVDIELDFSANSPAAEGGVPNIGDPTAR